MKSSERHEAKKEYFKILNTIWANAKALDRIILISMDQSLEKHFAQHVKEVKRIRTLIFEMIQNTESSEILEKNDEMFVT